MSTYDIELVEHMLPVLWDEEARATGIRSPLAPNPEMPKAKGNPAHMGTHHAMAADLDRAWRRAPLSTRQRRAVLMGYGFGMEQKEIAWREGVTQQAVSLRIRGALYAICNWLNGTDDNPYSEED